MSNRRQHGVTLVELIVALVIVGAAVAGLVAAFSSTAKSSAEPIIVRQMAAIADGMMEEVLLKPFDPAANTAAGRANFNDVFDFDAYATTAGIEDLNGDAIDDLKSYNVAVSVQRVSLRDVPNEAARIMVTVSYPGFDPVRLYGWRTRAAR